MIKFAKVKDEAIIPTKRDEDAGYDIYPCFEEDFIMIYPSETVMIPCGIASAFSDDYVIILKERGSTGTKGMAQRAGVIDSGYRGEWLCPITNTTTKTIFITDSILNESFAKTVSLSGEYTVYPKSKAICQAILLGVPKIDVKEITYDELKSIKSKRSDGKLGSSGK